MKDQSVDAVLFREFEGKKQVLLIKRKKNPYLGMYALIGGKVEDGEDLEAAIAREVEEEVGIINIDFKEIGNFVNEAGIRSTAYLGIVSGEYTFVENNEVSSVYWANLDNIPTLASNHNEMLGAAIKYLKDLFHQSVD